MLLIIYNICGIGSREPLEEYFESLQSIVGQQWDAECKIAVSACMSSPSILSAIKERFPQISIVAINEKWPVNATFNFTAHMLNEKHYNGVMYLDSGIVFNDQDDLLNILLGWESKECPAIYSVSVDTDMGFDQWQYDIPRNEIFKMPLGKATNCHAQIFSRHYWDEYGGLLPDIFAGHCTESVLTFLAAAICDEWWHDDTTVLKHRLGIDKQSGGFCTYNWVSRGGQTWDHPFIVPSVIPRVASDEARRLGLGYEELRGISLHNPECYDSNDYAKNPELADYCRNNLFLSREELPYIGVNYEVVE
jgi:hypothetical protein